MIPPGHPVAMFLQAFITQTLTYFAVVGLVFWVVWRWGASRLRGARIPVVERFDRRQALFEARNTLVTLALGSVNAVAISLLYASGKTKLTTDAAAVGPSTMVLTLVALLVFNDAWFYAWHRLLHHPKVFRHVHAVHHKSVDVNPFSSYSFHAVEGLVLGGWVIPVIVTVPIFLPLFGVMQGLGLANNVLSHLGYEFFPRWFVRVPPFRWLNTATFHSLHHTRLTGNYALMFRWWDRLFGTEVAEYEQTFVGRGARPPGRPRAHP